MREDELYPVEKRPETRVVAGIREGLSWAYRAPVARIVLTVITVVSLVGFNFHVLVPLLASQTLDVGAETFGLLSAAFGGGALVGALATATLREATTKVGVALVLLFGLGLSFALFTSSANALVQLSAPGHLRGRVMSVYMFAFAGLAPIGGLVSGWLAQSGGTPLAFGLAGVAGLAAVAWAARALRAVRVATA
jgi:MFS family permease